MPELSTTSENVDSSPMVTDTLITSPLSYKNTKPYSLNKYKPNSMEVNYQPKKSKKNPNLIKIFLFLNKQIVFSINNLSTSKFLRLKLSWQIPNKTKEEKRKKERRKWETRF